MSGADAQLDILDTLSTSILDCIEEGLPFLDTTS